MELSAYLTFDGKCKEAFEFYQSVLGGQIVMMMSFKDVPAGEAPAAPGTENFIMHARLSVDGQTLMGSDAPPPYFSQPQGFSVSIVVEDDAKGKKIFDALSAGGQIKMPYGPTFWAIGFGMAIDKFGTPWMVNCERSQ